MKLNTPQTQRFRRRLLALPLLALLAACGKEPAPPEPPRPVLTRVLGDTAGDETLTYSGEVRSRYETPLAFRIPGKITARWSMPAAVVKAGEVLARLDPADSALSASGRCGATGPWRRRSRALAQSAPEELRQPGGARCKETSFKAAQAQAELARNQTAYTILKAEQAGVIGLITAEVGQVVAAGQTVMRLARADTLEVAISIPEARMPTCARSEPPR
jgi:multidrug efflux system membrane fusion protein